MFFFLCFHLPVNFSTKPPVIEISSSDSLHPLPCSQIQRVATSASPTSALFLPSEVLIPSNVDSCSVTNPAQLQLREGANTCTAVRVIFHNMVHVMLFSYLQCFHSFALFKEINSWYLVSTYLSVLSLVKFPAAPSPGLPNPHFLLLTNEYTFMTRECQANHYISSLPCSYKWSSD